MLCIYKYVKEFPVNSQWQRGKAFHHRVVEERFYYYFIVDSAWLTLSLSAGAGSTLI